MWSIWSNRKCNQGFPSRGQLILNQLRAGSALERRPRDLRRRRPRGDTWHTPPPTSTCLVSFFAPRQRAHTIEPVGCFLRTRRAVIAARAVCRSATRNTWYRFASARLQSATHCPNDSLDPASDICAFVGLFCAPDAACINAKEARGCE